MFEAHLASDGLAGIRGLSFTRWFASAWPNLYARPAHSPSTDTILPHHRIPSRIPEKCFMHVVASQVHPESQKADSRSLLRHNFHRASLKLILAACCVTTSILNPPKLLLTVCCVITSLRMLENCYSQFAALQLPLRIPTNCLSQFAT